MNREAIRVNYTARCEWLENEVLDRLRNLLCDARREFHRQCPNVALPKMPECRVKEFARIIEKLERKNRIWPHDDLFVNDESGNLKTIVNDLVAGRIVCATPSDVECLATIMKNWTERLTDVQGEFVQVKDTGYRAYHIDARVEVFDGNTRLFFPVEIQIKTLLQDAWANFGHDEFYKTSQEPPEISKAISRHLADTLAGLDMIGQAIREEKLQKRPAPFSIGPEETLVTPRTLNYLAGKIFQINMSQVELQRCIAQLKAFGYESIASVDALARDGGISNMIEVAKTRIRMSGKPTPYEVLFFGPLAAEGEIAVTAELRRMYGLTELTCAGCEGPISEDEKRFIDMETDLDLIYFCSKCTISQLTKCKNCGKLTESDTCKECRAQDPSSEIV